MINLTQKRVRQVCIPLLLLSFYSCVSLAVAFGVNTAYSINYLLFDVFSRRSVHSVAYLHVLFLVHFLLRHTVSVHFSVVLHIASWLHILGHMRGQQNTAACFKSAYTFFVFAPYFTFLETFYPWSYGQKDKYTIIRDEYDGTKKSIVYFAGLFQKAQVEYKDIAKGLSSFNHIYINTNFAKHDSYRDTLVKIVDELGGIDIECAVGFSFGGSLALQFKEMYYKDIKTILISPAGFENNTWVETIIRLVGRWFFLVYRNDKWYMIHNYPTYQNTNTLSSTDYVLASTADVIHPSPIKTHTNTKTLQNVSHLNMIRTIQKQGVISRLIHNGYDLMDIKAKPLTNWVIRLLMGSFFYPYHVTVWLCVSGYHIYLSSFIKYNYMDYIWYGFLSAGLYSILEYGIHRFALHRIFHNHHNKHHLHPTKTSLLFSPMVVILCMGGVVYYLCSQKARPIIFTIGPLYYIAFELTHAFSHKYKGPNKILVNAKQFHKVHHINETTNYGFLTPFWDYIFGTLSPTYTVCVTELVLGFIPFYSFAIRCVLETHISH